MQMVIALLHKVAAEYAEDDPSTEASLDFAKSGTLMIKHIPTMSDDGLHKGFVAEPAGYGNMFREL